MKYHVNWTASGIGDGSLSAPFRTIQEAANVAQPGDEILVYPGIYREYVNPLRGGTPEQRIRYVSTTPGKAVISGAEEVKNWIPFRGDVWVCRVPNSLFPDRNPYTTQVSGDWFNAFFTAHTGEVSIRCAHG